MNLIELLFLLGRQALVHSIPHEAECFVGAFVARGVPIPRAKQYCKITVICAITVITVISAITAISVISAITVITRLEVRDALTVEILLLVEREE